MNSQRGFTMLAYGLIALAILGAVAGLIAWADQNIETSAGVERGESNVQAKWDAANAKARAEEAAKGDAAAKGLEVRNAKARVIYRTITQAVDRIVEKPVYRNVCLDARGVCLGNAAISGTDPSTCKLDKPVPAATAPDGRGGLYALALDHGERGVLQGVRR